MKKESVKFFVMVVLFFCLALPAQAGNFKNVVVFGDSLSDSGNVFTLQKGIYPPAPYQGRFSDGPVWVEYLVKSLGLTGSFCNFAFGGANTGTINPAEHNVPGFLSQVSAYTALLTGAAAFPTAFPQPKETLFIIWIGGNDFLGPLADPLAAVADAVVHIRSGMTQLASVGAVTFMVVNLPDLGITPRMNQDAALSAKGTQLSHLFNDSLEGMLVGFEDDHPTIEVVRLDSFSLLHEMVANPELGNFDNVTDVKFDKNDGSVAEGRYLFWDDIHPTTITHKILARQAASLLTCDCMGQPRFDSSLTLTVPYAEIGNDAVGFRLDYCQDPAADPNGYYWKLDPASIAVK